MFSRQITILIPSSKLTLNPTKGGLLTKSSEHEGSFSSRHIPSFSRRGSPSRERSRGTPQPKEQTPLKSTGFRRDLLQNLALRFPGGLSISQNFPTQTDPLFAFRRARARISAQGRPSGVRRASAPDVGEVASGAQPQSPRREPKDRSHDRQWRWFLLFFVSYVLVLFVLCFC